VEYRSRLVWVCPIRAVVDLGGLWDPWMMVGFKVLSVLSLSLRLCLVWWWRSMGRASLRRICRAARLILRSHDDDDDDGDDDGWCCCSLV